MLTLELFSTPSSVDNAQYLRSLIVHALVAARDTTNGAKRTRSQPRLSDFFSELKRETGVSAFLPESVCVPSKNIRVDFHGFRFPVFDDLVFSKPHQALSDTFASVRLVNHQVFDECNLSPMEKGPPK